MTLPSQVTAEQVKQECAVSHLLEKSKHGMYCCPFCGSGNGPNGTGAVKIYENRMQCFSCGRNASVIDVYMHLHGLTQDRFEEAVRGLASEFGLGGGTSWKPAPPPAPESGNPCRHEEGPQPMDEFFRTAEARLQSGADGQAGRDYLAGRGLSLEAAKCLHLGYCPSLDMSGHGHAAPRLVIPMSSTSYIGIDVRPDADPKYRRMNSTGGKSVPLNLDALWDADGPDCVYVTEGWADAMSLLTVGRQAVALNGTGSIGRLTEALRAKQTRKTLLMCLDNDDAGRAASVQLAADLTQMNVPHVRVTSDVCGSSKDPNEALTADPEKFTAGLAAAEHRALRPDAADIYIRTQLADDIVRGRGCTATGFPQFDQLAGGGLYPGMYIIGAIPSLGKTTWMLQIAGSIARHGTPVIYVSLEMSAMELVTKSLAARYAEESAVQRTISSMDIRQTAEAFRTVWDSGVLDMYLNDTAPNLSILEGNYSCDVDFVCDYVRRFAARNSGARRPVVIIDYLQILDPDPSCRCQDQRQSLDSVVKALKRLSRELSVTVVAISSLNRANYQMPVFYESFKESGAIEYCADVVLGMQLECVRTDSYGKISETAKREEVQKARDEYPRRVCVTCLKNRFGRTGWTCFYRYYAACDYFAEAEGPALFSGQTLSSSRKTRNRR